MSDREKAKTLHDVMMDKVMTERQIDVSLYLQLTGSFLSGLYVNVMCLYHRELRSMLYLTCSYSKMTGRLKENPGMFSD